MDNHPPARRPHKSPAHTVKDHRVGLSAFPFSPQHQSARGSRTSYSEFQGRQHLTAPVFTAVPALRSAPQGVPVSGARIVHTPDKNGKWGNGKFLRLTAKLQSPHVPRAITK